MTDHPISETVARQLLVPNSVKLIERTQGGLSGAMIWRCSSRFGPACLRCWPAQHPQPERLRLIHTAISRARQAGLSTVPALSLTPSGASFVSDGQRLWELTEWLPGAADYLEHPTPDKLAAAAFALADLHQAWSRDRQLGVSPTIQDRLARLDFWLQPTQLNRLAAQPAASQSIPTTPQLLSLPPSPQYGTAQTTSQTSDSTRVHATLQMLLAHGPPLRERLVAIAPQQVPLQFVLRDVWSDHILYTGEQVTGIIDYGAVRIDEPATDLARLLGSLEPFDAQRRQTAWAIYREKLDTSCLPPALGANGVQGTEFQRVDLLDHVATLLSALQWYQWLILEQRAFPGPTSLLRERWDLFLARLRSNWPP
ncbi:phosphotransferase [Aureliella helgolandensis]|uniref:Phosphotransferase enzyme family protein n=1 Tax=Aureliella helgolandensis TaxID=2527968 RepID=A0A518GCI1_9BACT|nr:phosphotransferase [Aureliella helgolandensis]QDV26257.1 Phosphotransferase enzyme family protein [Aureliella helgolandensis]